MPDETEYEVAAREAERAAAGGYADGVRVRYQVGPDGRRYAVDSQVKEA